MSEVAVFLAAQPSAVRAGLYVTSLVFMLVAGGFALSLVIGAMNAVGGAVTDNRDWQIGSRPGSKEEVLRLLAVAVYSALLITLEPSIRALALTAGNALVTSFIVAPLIGVALRTAADAEHAS